MSEFIAKAEEEGSVSCVMTPEVQTEQRQDEFEV
jgi:hypothetical protein